jgi:hypothetical protein
MFNLVASTHVGAIDGFSMFIMFLAWPVVCEIAAGYYGMLPRLGG